MAPLTSPFRLFPGDVDVDQRQVGQGEPVVRAPLSHFAEQLEATFALRAVLIRQGEAMDSSSEVKGEVVTRLLSYGQESRSVAQRRRVGQQHPVRDREDVHEPYDAAKDRGCTKPGCDAPAYHSQVHHVRGWTTTRRTDITDLTLACGPDNRLAEKGWTTRTNTHGHTEWIPPPHLDHGQPRTNAFHHPERFLRGQDDDEPD